MAPEIQFQIALNKINDTETGAGELTLWVVKDPEGIEGTDIKTCKSPWRIWGITWPLTKVCNY